MRTPTCPRCDGALHDPRSGSGSWTCDIHGEVQPLQPAEQPSAEGLRAVLRLANVPVWLPWPLPADWLVTGFAYAGDEDEGAAATVVALSGPAPLGGPGDLVIIAEELGVGLGAHFAGLTGPDPGAGFDAGTPHARVAVNGHPTPLWSVDAGPDRAAFVGEAMGRWLWAVLWPASAGLLLLEEVSLRDLRDGGEHLPLPYGAMSARLK